MFAYISVWDIKSTELYYVKNYEVGKIYEQSEEQEKFIFFEIPHDMFRRMGEYYLKVNILGPIRLNSESYWTTNKIEVLQILTTFQMNYEMENFMELIKTEVNTLTYDHNIKAKDITPDNWQKGIFNELVIHNMKNNEYIIMTQTCDCFWFKDGKLHRPNDLPAIHRSNGIQEWYKYNLRHRDNWQPAFTMPSGHKVWFENDRQVIPPPLFRDKNKSYTGFNKSIYDISESVNKNKKRFRDLDAVDASNALDASNASNESNKQHKIIV
jgi:hypothetical protein